jgi:hypothetical protein
MGKSKKFWDNFRLNQWLSDVRKAYVERDLRIDWENISPELQEEINALTYKIKRVLDLSNQECKKAE